MKDYSFGNYICALRTGLGLSQFQLGTLVGVSDKAVSKWENGDSKPRLATCNRLAEVLGVSVNELLSCKQYVTITARKEINKLNRKLWKQAYERLNTYGETPPIECWSRLAAEKAALYLGFDRNPRVISILIGTLKMILLSKICISRWVSNSLNRLGVAVKPRSRTSLPSFRISLMIMR